MPSRREARKFTTPESFHLFMEGLRSLQDYDCESGKIQPDSEVLKKTLLDAQKALETCVLNYPDDILPHYYLGMVFTVHAQVEQALYLRRLLEKSFTTTDLIRLPDEAAYYLWKAVEHFAETGKRAGLGDVQRYACYNQAQALARLDPHTPDLTGYTDETSNWYRAKKILCNLQIPGFKTEFLGHGGFRASYSIKELLGSRGFRGYSSVLKYWWNRILSRKTARENEALALQTSMVINFIELREDAWKKSLILDELPQSPSPEPCPPKYSSAPSDCLKCLLEQIHAITSEKIRQDMLADYWNKWAFVSWERALLEEQPAVRAQWLEAVRRYLQFIGTDRSWWTPWQINMVRLLEAVDQMMRALQADVLPQKPDVLEGIQIMRPLKFRKTGDKPEEAASQKKEEPAASAQQKTPKEAEANDWAELQEQCKKNAEDMLERILGMETPPPAPQLPASAVDVDKIAAVVAVWAAERDAIATASNMRRGYPGLSADVLGKIAVALAGKVPATLLDQIFRQYSACQ